MPINQTMDVGFSVFNSHINEADKRVRAYMLKHYPELLAEVQLLERGGDGIMVIFSCKPTRATMMYSFMVTALVNKDVIELDAEPIVPPAAPLEWPVPAAGDHPAEAAAHQSSKLKDHQEDSP